MQGCIGRGGGRLPPPPPPLQGVLWAMRMAAPTCDRAQGGGPASMWGHGPSGTPAGPYQSRGGGMAPSTPPPPAPAQCVGPHSPSESRPGGPPGQRHVRGGGGQRRWPPFRTRFPRRPPLRRPSEALRRTSAHRPRLRRRAHALLPRPPPQRDPLTIREEVPPKGALGLSRREGRYARHTPGPRALGPAGP